MNAFLRLSIVAATAALAGTSADAQLQWRLRETTTAPAARYGHAMTRVHPSYQAYLFGGRDGAAAFGDTWRWNGQSWTLRATTGPAARHDHALASYHFEDDSIVLFGGRDASGALLGDTWLWNGSSWSQTPTGVAPSPRAGHAIAKDEWEIKTVVLFGGRTAQGLSNETWRFVNGQWSQVPVVGPQPPAREGHALTRLSGSTHLLLVGGRDDSGVRSDVWEFDGTKWTPFGELASPRADAAIVFEDMWRGRALSFGGDSGEANGAMGDTQELLWNTSWVTHDTIGAPQARTDAAIALGSGGANAEYVMFGGRASNGAALGDTFTLEPVTTPSMELVGQGCGTGAWGFDGANLLASPPLLGSEFSLQAFVGTMTPGLFVIGPELAPAAPGSCGLQVNPLILLPATPVAVLPELPIAELTAPLPFAPAFNGTAVSIQVLMSEPALPGGVSFSRVVRLHFAL